MTDHTTAYVPIESWCYASPDVRYDKKVVDIGLLAESLLYYEQVYFSLSSQPQFAELITWFLRQDAEHQFIELLNEGTIRVYHHCFASVPIQAQDGSYGLWNIEDELQKKPEYFSGHFLQHPAISKALEPAKDKQAIIRGLQAYAQEAKSDAYAPAIENAREDYRNPSRCALIVQCLLDEVWPILELGPVPQVKASVVHSGSKTNIRWTVDSPYFKDTTFFDHLSRILGKEAGFRPASPLAAAGEANRMIVTASHLRCDLYLPKPVSRIVGDKLSESVRINRLQRNIELLKHEVEFPNIRQLVNANTLSVSDILAIRKKAQSFRSWLQTESGRDRNALIAYHKEISEATGLLKYGRAPLSIFGFLSGITLAYVVEGKFDALAGAIATGVANATPSFLLDLGFKFGSGWKPVVFGDWLIENVNKTARKRK